MSQFPVVGLVLGLAAILALQGCGEKGGGGEGGDISTTVTTTAQKAPTTTAQKAPATTTTTTAITTTVAAATTTTATTSPRLYPGGLRYCEDLSTFYKVSYDLNGTKMAAGQCMPSLVPGAYYTNPGDKDPDGMSDKSWQCFSPDTAHYLWTNAHAVEQGFVGACIFGDYSSTTTPDQIDDCTMVQKAHPAKCSPGPSMYWGACYKKGSPEWKCVPLGDATIPGLAKGDCKAGVVNDAGGAPTKDFFDGVCRFKEETPVVYKCDTVTEYHEGDASTCSGGGANFDKACFTLKNGVGWQCMDPDTPWGASPCDWTQLPDSSGDFYKGACVFPGNDQYKHAVNAHNVTNVVKGVAIVI